MNSPTAPVYTIGHSNHPVEKLLDLLRAHRVTAVADVRSSPFSRYNPQFDRENLQVTLREAGIHYVFLGRELGARSEDPDCYEGGRVVYGRLARTALFQQGLDWIRQGMARHRVSLLCAEKDPLTCHRTILVSREFVRDGIPVCHILEDGSVESHDKALERLLRQFGLHEEDLFQSYEERIDEAYRLQEERIAYVSAEMAES